MHLQPFTNKLTARKRGFHAAKTNGCWDVRKQENHKFKSSLNYSWSSTRNIVWQRRKTNRFFIFLKRWGNKSFIWSLLRVSGFFHENCLGLLSSQMTVYFTKKFQGATLGELGICFGVWEIGFWIWKIQDDVWSRGFEGELKQQKCEFFLSFTFVDWWFHNEGLGLSVPGKICQSVFQACIAQWWCESSLWDHITG